MYFRTAFVIVSDCEKKIRCLMTSYFEIGLIIGFMKYQVKDFDDFRIRVYGRFFIIETVNSTVSSTRVGCYIEVVSEPGDRFLRPYRYYKL